MSFQTMDPAKIKMEIKQEEQLFLSDEYEVDSTSDNDNSLNENETKRVEFPCPVCKKIFRKKGHRKRHLLTHEPEKPFVCILNFCSKRFAAKYSLQQHLIKQHGMEAKPFECDICEKQFTLQEEFDRHKTMHEEPSKSYTCNLCRLRFKQYADLQSHVKNHDDEASYSYQCNICNKRFPRKYNLTRHKRTHNNNKPFHCDVCNKDFSTPNGQQMHLQTHETHDKPFSCDQCDKRFTVQQNLELHVSFHSKADEKPYGCDLCEVRFMTQERLERHIETHGSREGRVFPCQYCVRTFPRKYNLIRHEYSHTHGRKRPKDTTQDTSQGKSQKNQNVDSSKVIKGLKQKQSFKCDLCSISFESETSLNLHLASVGHLRKLKAHQCTTCLECFTTEDSLKKHLTEVHFCLICSKKFKYQNDLKKHKIGHYSKATRSKSLKRRQQLHRQTKRNKSSYISDVKLSSLRFDSVKKKTSSNSKYQCHICDKSFSRAFNLARHQKSHKELETTVIDNTNHKEFLEDSILSSTNDVKPQIDSDQLNINPDETIFVKSEIIIGIENDVEDSGQITTTVHEKAVEEALEMNTCSICSEIFSNLTDLRSHEKTHETQDTSTKSTSTSNNDLKKKKQRLRCGLCPLSFKYESSLNLHLASAKHLEKLKKHRCSDARFCSICLKQPHHESDLNTLKISNYLKSTVPKSTYSRLKTTPIIDDECCKHETDNTMMGDLGMDETPLDIKIEEDNEMDADAGPQLNSLIKPHEIIVCANANLRFEFENENDEDDV